MSNGFAKVICIGNLGRDPEVKTTNSGKAVCNLSVACTERGKNKEGNWEDQTEWVRVTCFDKTAENVGKFCSKGKQVFVEGRLRTREWTDKDGNKRTTTEVLASQVVFLGGGKNNEKNASASNEPPPNGTSTGKTASSQSAPNTNNESPPITDDDIPF